jgi:hypothetical protein
MSDVELARRIARLRVLRFNLDRIRHEALKKRFRKTALADAWTEIRAGVQTAASGGTMSSAIPPLPDDSPGDGKQP